MIKQTIEETEKEAMELYAKKLQGKSKSEQNKRKKLMAQAEHVADTDLAAKDKIAMASKMAATVSKSKVEKHQ
jgi:hypothetical protein